MSDQSTKPAGAGGRGADGQDGGQQLHKLRRRTQRLAHRVGELEAEMQESRRLQRRVAELTDVVAELLLPLTSRDDARVRELLERFEPTSAAEGSEAWPASAEPRD